MFAGSASSVLASSAVLLVLFALACASDLRTRRIPNLLVVVMALSGIIWALVTKSWVGGLTHAGTGAVIGLLIWLPFYAFRMLGAGDVKLFAAASTFLGPRAAVEGALYTALFGGGVALTYMIIQSGWLATLVRVSHAVHQPDLLHVTPAPQRRPLPYALAITAGVLAAYWWPGHILT